MAAGQPIVQTMALLTNLLLIHFTVEGETIPGRTTATIQSKTRTTAIYTHKNR